MFIIFAVSRLQFNNVLAIVYFLLFEVYLIVSPLIPQNHAEGMGGHIGDGPA